MAHTAARHCTCRCATQPCLLPAGAGHRRAWQPRHAHCPPRAAGHGRRARRSHSGQCEGGPGSCTHVWVWRMAWHGCLAMVQVGRCALHGTRVVTLRPQAHICSRCLPCPLVCAPPPPSPPPPTHTHPPTQAVTQGHYRLVDDYQKTVSAGAKAELSRAAQAPLE